jgi:hypothetical protein
MDMRDEYEPACELAGPLESDIERAPSSMNDRSIRLDEACDVDRASIEAGVDHPILDHSKALREAVDRLGWSSSETLWQGWNVHHEFICAAGHSVRTTPSAIKRGITSCAECRNLRWFDRMKAAAERDRVICLESAWRGVAASYRFRCLVGHEFVRSPRHGIGPQGALGCFECVGEATRRKKQLADGLEQLRAISMQHGGECLSEQYLGYAQRYGFRCAQGHEWSTVGSNVFRGSWCGQCANDNKRQIYRVADGLQRLHDAALHRGGLCLSDSYDGRRARYEFVCASGHRWIASGTNILNGSWCLDCANDRKRLSIEDARGAASERGGQCLSAAYRNAQQKLSWVCHAGHSWNAALSSVRAGHWCPECASAARVTNRKSNARLRYSGEGRHGRA